MSRSNVHYAFRRITCRGDDHVELSLEVWTSASGKSSVRFDVDSAGAATLEDARYEECIRKGVEEVLGSAKPHEKHFAVRVVGVSDLSGQTAPFTFQMCARKAMTAYLDDEAGEAPEQSE